MYLCTPSDSTDLLWGILFLDMLQVPLIYDSELCQTAVSAAVMLSLKPQSVFHSTGQMIQMTSNDNTLGAEPRFPIQPMQSNLERQHKSHEPQKSQTHKSITQSQPSHNFLIPTVMIPMVKAMMA